MWKVFWVGSVLFGGAWITLHVIHWKQPLQLKKNNGDEGLLGGGIAGAFSDGDTAPQMMGLVETGILLRLGRHRLCSSQWRNPATRWRIRGVPLVSEGWRSSCQPGPASREQHRSGTRAGRLGGAYRSGGNGSGLDNSGFGGCLWNERPVTEVWIFQQRLKSPSEGLWCVVMSDWCGGVDFGVWKLRLPGKQLNVITGVCFPQMQLHIAVFGSQKHTHARWSNTPPLELYFAHQAPGLDPGWNRKEKLSQSGIPPIQPQAPNWPIGTPKIQWYVLITPSPHQYEIAWGRGAPKISYAGCHKRWGGGSGNAPPTSMESPTEKGTINFFIRGLRSGDAYFGTSWGQEKPERSYKKICSYPHFFGSLYLKLAETPDVLHMLC